MILKTRAVAAIATPKRHPKFFWMAKTWDGQNVPALIEIPMSGRMPSVAFADNDFSDVQIGDLFFVENEASPHGHWKRMINQSESRDLRVPHFGEPRFLSKGTAAKPQFQACFPSPNERLYPSLSIFIHLYPQCPNHSPNIRCLGMKRIVVLTFSRKNTSTMENHHIFDR